MNIVWYMNPIEAFMQVLGGVCCGLFAVWYLLHEVYDSIRLWWASRKKDDTE